MEDAHPTPLGLPDLAGLPARPGAVRPNELPADGCTRLLSAPSAPDTALWCALLGGATLADDELQALWAMGQVRQVAQGDCVLSRTSNASTLVALRSGEVALGYRTADGVFRTERIVRGPAWLDLSSAWLAGPHAMDALALNAASVIDLPQGALADRLAQLPGLAQRLIHGLAREVRALAVNTHGLMYKDAPARLAQWLHQRCEPVAGAEGQAIVRLHERKRDVASQLAITPETLSRLMRSFSRKGVIEVSGYNLRVLDPAALERLGRA
jgi:CRP-like cAMP-binding protein